MRPALPEEPDPAGGQEWLSAEEVGDFRQGTAFSRWALARYLVGRAIARSLSDTLLVIALALLVLAAAVGYGLRVGWLAVVVAIFAVGVLALRWLVRAALARFTDARRYRPVETTLRRLVADTRSDVMAELRRLGLPSHTVTLPVLALRLAGRRRADTIARLRRFDTERAVPAVRLDELHLLLRDPAGHVAANPGGAGR